MSAQKNHQTSQPPLPSPSGAIAQCLVQLQTDRQKGQVSPISTESPLATHKTESRKEIREWLNILGVFLIPLLIGVYTIVNNTQQATFSAQNRQADIQNQLDQQQEATLKAYLDDMAALLIDKNLRNSQPSDEVRIVARAKTIATLRRLDATRNGIVIQFLADAHLIGVDSTGKKKYTIIDFSNADLEYDNLSGVSLDYIISLNGANLYSANLSFTNLSFTDLSYANLENANLEKANLGYTNLYFADLGFVKMSFVNLGNAHLNQASLYYSDLQHSLLSDADLSNADLRGANLSNADLRGADLKGADFEGANLRGATVTPQQLSQATTLKDAIMPDGSTHP